MVITNSQVNMGSKRLYQASSMERSTLMTWNRAGLKKLDMEDNSYRKESSAEDSGTGLDSGNLSFSESMDDIYEKQMNVAATKNSMLTDSKNNTRMQFLSLSYLLHWLFGKKYYTDEEWNEAMNNAISGYQGEGGSFTYESYRAETEITTFQTTGTIKTADGREINFNLNLSMTRSFQEYYQEKTDWGDALLPPVCDPLVINLDGSPANISDQSFLFDIDADGTLDTVSLPTGKSGFLALDRNGDGIINDGSELFGTESGDGFADLAKFDSDENGWIDEADEIFEKLMIYSKDSNGEDKLVSIGKAGVGAIYLGNSGTQFSLKNNTGDTNAFIRKTGIFLYENGGMGTIQHVDLAVKEA
ncbi:MAG: hypothetical protein K6F37_07615 [Lachnospiraceae bacterium]|nr:hypothetical protein [Lachnospiraceae bacterium]